MLQLLRWNSQFGSDVAADPQELIGKSQWLSKLRWIAIAAQVLCLWPGLQIGLLSQQDIGLYLSAVGFLVAFNLNHDRIFRTFKISGENGLLVQLGVDLFALAALLSLSKGCSNPMIALFYLHAAIGPLLLSGFRNVIFLAITCAALVAVCFSSMPMMHGPDGMMLPRWIRLSSEIAVVCIVWQLTTWLSRYLVELRASVSRLEKQKSRIDNLRALGAMAASFSHEFATPLNTIKVRLDRLRRQQPDLERSSDLTSALNGVEQCEGVLKSLFGANPDCGSVQFEKVPIADFVESACAKWNVGQASTSFAFRSEQGAREVRCRIPSIVLARSIIDLLDNARDASVADKSSIEVTVSVQGKQAVVEVADRGPGISDGIRKQLGSPFVSTKEGGTGLGLFSAYALAEALGGALNIRDRQGGGAIVGLSIPIAEGGT